MCARAGAHVCEHVCVCEHAGEKAARASPQRWGSLEFLRGGGTERSGMEGVPIPGRMSLSPSHARGCRCCWGSISDPPELGRGEIFFSKPSSPAFGAWRTGIPAEFHPYPIPAGILLWLGG